VLRPSWLPRFAGRQRGRVQPATLFPQVRRNESGDAQIEKLYEHASVIITTNPVFAEWARVFGDPKMTTVL